MKKIILVILLNILFIDSAISQQVLQSRASYSLIKSTIERIYVKTYYEIHSVYFPIYEKWFPKKNIIVLISCTFYFYKSKRLHFSHEKRLKKFIKYQNGCKKGRRKGARFFTMQRSVAQCNAM